MENHATIATGTATPTELPRDLLTVEQAAAMLHLSQSSIRSYMREGKLVGFRIAGLRKVRIPRDAVLGLLEGITPPGTSA